jgi:hypothetical protein
MANPVDWVKKKVHRTTEQPKQTVGQLPEGPPSAPPPGQKPKGSRYWYEQHQRDEAETQSKVNAAEKARQEAERLYSERLDETRQQAERASRAEKDSSYWKQFGASKAPGESDSDYQSRTGKTNAKPEEDPRFANFSKKDKKRFAKMAQDAERAKLESELEAQVTGVPQDESQYQKVYQNGWHFRTTDGKAVTEQYAKAHPEETDYHPGQWVFQEVKRKLSPAEVTNLVRQQRMNNDAWKAYQNEKKYGGLKSAAAVAGNVAQGMGQAAVVGIAGIGSAMQAGGRGAPSMGVPKGSLTPSVPLELYAPHRENIGAQMSTVRQITSPGHSVNLAGGNLNHLRAATIPTIRMPQQTQRPLPIAGQPYNPPPQRIPVTGSNSLKKLNMPSIRTNVPDLSRLKNTVRRKAGL